MNTVPHNTVQVTEGDIAAVTEAMRQGHLSCGVVCAELEKQLAQLTQRAECVCVSSGFAALRLALKALNIEPGDEVIVPAYSCVALPNAVLALGAVPVPADVAPHTWNLTVATVAPQCTSRTKAIIAVHLFGLPAPVADLAQLGLPVVEDCAHALGFAPEGRPIGSSGALAVTSFYATKLLGGAKGGAIFTNDSQIAFQLRAFRDYNNQPCHAQRGNDTLTDMEAALVRYRLSQLPTVLEKRALLATRYTCALATLEELGQCLRPVHAGTMGARAWYRYALELTKHPTERIANNLHSMDIQASAHPVVSWLGLRVKDFPVTAHALERLLSLPLFPTMTSMELDRVVAALSLTLR